MSACSVVVLSVAGALLAGVAPNSPALVLCGVGIFVTAQELVPLSTLVVLFTALVALAAGTAAFGQAWTESAGYGAALAGILLAGFNRRQYHTRLAQAEALATQTQRAHEEHARASMLSERARIAREIHDVLAHSLGALSVQLDAADALLEEDSARAREYVVRARRLTVEGLTETRRAIGTLRGDSGPLPEQLRTVVEQRAHDTATTVRLNVTGAVHPLAPNAGLAVVRTAQEGLSNATKHAPGATNDLDLDYRQNEVVLTVTTTATDPATPAAATGAATGSDAASALADSGGGYGLTGLRERAAMLGGTLTAGRTPSGTWQLRLALPTTGEQPR
jgi:signal transduction histidine kinase